MRVSLRLKSCLAWAVLIETCLLVFIFIRGNSLFPSVNNVMIEAPSFDESQISDEDYDLATYAPPVAKTLDLKHLDFSGLPDLETAVATKSFLSNLHSLGYIGRNGTFQSVLEHLTVERILANLILKPECVEKLNTVSIDLAMLTDTQIVDCYIYTSLLLHDLIFLLSHGEATQVAPDDINYVISRLTYLNKYFKKELNHLKAVS